jgi:hypothetical protein
VMVRSRFGFCSLPPSYSIGVGSQGIDRHVRDTLPTHDVLLEGMSRFEVSSSHDRSMLVLALCELPIMTAEKTNWVASGIPSFHSFVISRRPGRLSQRNLNRQPLASDSEMDVDWSLSLPLCSDRLWRNAELQEGGTQW